ncbi:MAG TPA: VWA domain-containing protein [Candidatus Acidoferrum sp.]
MIMMDASPAAVGAVKEYLGEETAFRTGNRSELTLQAFQHLARYLSGLPARKNVIWFADTFPISFMPEDKVHTRRHQEHVRQTSDMLTAAQVAIYPVSARGLIGDGSFDIPVDTQREMLDEFANTQIAMETLTQETGGRAFYNTNALDEAMAKAIVSRPKTFPSSRPKGFAAISRSTSLPAISTSAPGSTISTPATPAPSAFHWEQLPPRIARRSSSNPRRRS